MLAAAVALLLSIAAVVVFLTQRAPQDLLLQRAPGSMGMLREEPFFEWCEERKLPPYKAPEGSESKVVHKVRLLPGSGACSALLGVMDAAMYSEAFGHSYFVDESITRLKGNHTAWFNRFFQPTGLAAEPAKSTDITWNKTVVTWRFQDYLSVGGVRDGRLNMRRVWLRRLWAFQPWVQRRFCPALKALGLRSPYIAVMIRRGDKDKEKRLPVPMDQIVDTLRGLSVNGAIREFFVASDDCRVLGELREAMPESTFKSLCHMYEGHGWQLAEDTTTDLDMHFYKFFGELTAMAASTFYIGDSFSTVHFWATYMRPLNSSNATFFNMRKYPFHGKLDLN